MVADKGKTEPAEADPMETAKRIMKRLAETPYEPHKPLGKRQSKVGPSPTPTPKAKSRRLSQFRREARSEMATVTCAECRQIATVSAALGAAQYKFEYNRCTQRARPSTPQERFVDSTKCPSLEKSIEAVRQRGDI